MNMKGKYDRLPGTLECPLETFNMKFIRPVSIMGFCPPMFSCTGAGPMATIMKNTSWHILNAYYVSDTF